MAEGGDLLVSATLACVICQDLMNDPMTVPCGHSYCSDCIQSHWDEEKKNGIWSCPLCREMFRKRPKLKKNVMLAEVVADLNKSRAAAAELCYSGPEDVACDVCTDKKLKAVKSCVVCLASYCEIHLQAHYNAAPLKKHKLVPPSRMLQENICPHHDRVMEIFCRTDQQCICYLCTLDHHRGHETVSAAAERSAKQKELEANRQNIQQKILERQKDVELLQQQMEAINVSIEDAVEHNEESFTKAIRVFLKTSCEMEHKLRSQQQTAVRGVTEHQEKLEMEIAQLKRKDAQLEQLAHTEDHNRFLHSFPSASVIGELPLHLSYQNAPLRYLEDVAAAVSESRETIQAMLRATGTGASRGTAEEESLLSRARSKTRDYFLVYFRQISLDPNTAHRRLVLLERNKKVALTPRIQPFCDHPDRFTDHIQVLSRESVTGSCYFEVEWRGRIKIAVAYKSTRRPGRPENQFGSNDQSWALHCDVDSLSFSHNNNETPIRGLCPSRVGVFLDKKAGVLSFYGVSEAMTLLHMVETVFTQPLHVGVTLYVSPARASAEFVKLQ